MRSVTGIPQRPQAPEHLSATARQIWDDVTSARPPDFFDKGTRPALEAFCAACAEHRRLMAVIEGLSITDPEGLDAYAKLTRLADAHAGRIGTLATKLRLTKQATTDSRAGGRAARADSSTVAERMAARYDQ